HRVTGDRLMFAMPETGIGFFPDVGGTYFLPRMPGKGGTWLALTTSRLGQADALWSGFATHAIASDDLEAVLQALCEKGDPDATLAAFAKPSGNAPAEAMLDVVNRCFAGETVE